MAGVIARLFEAHLTVRRLDESIRFYRDRLGLELAHRRSDGRAAFFWTGARGDGMLGLWAAGAGPERVVGHIAFTARLADLLEAATTLEDAGIAALDFDGQPTREPVVIAWMPAAAIFFRDPDGHLLEFIAMLDANPRPDLGVVSWSAWTRRQPPA